MSKRNMLIIAGAIFIGIFLFFYLTGNQKPKYFNWSENYRTESKHPYGVYIYHELLKSHFGTDQFSKLESPISANLSRKDDQSMYVLIGESAYYDYEDIDSLKAFVAAGNDALIATLAFPYDLTYELLETECGVVKLYNADHVNMKLKGQDEAIPYEFIINQEVKIYEWSNIDSISCDEMDILGYLDDEKVNFIKIAYGEGAFYIHTSPLVFTNYYLNDEKALSYVEGITGYFQGSHLFWDDYSKIPFLDNQNKENPLKYILSQPALRWAWYLLIITTVVYFIFYAKRRQRIIPVLAANKNSTIEFAETMGYLYFEEQSHNKIAEHKWSLFLAYLRTRYYLHTQVIDENLIKKISLKSLVSTDEIGKIIKEYQRLNFKVEISAEELINFHDIIESFYQKSK